MPVEADVLTFRRFWKETGFDGYVSVEAFPVFGEYESARMSIETLKEALAEQ